MIATEKRKEAKRLLLSFSDGSITNDEFEAKYPIDSSDPALGGIFRRLWFIWDDRYEHALAGQHALKENERDVVLRCLAFLDSNLEYQWPKAMFMAPFSVMLCRLLRMHKIAERLDQKKLEQLGRIGDPEVWPFLSKSDYLESIRAD